MSKADNWPRGQPPAVYARADEEYQAYTSQVSLITRTLALAAIAIIWLFASSKQGLTLSPFNALRRLESARPLLLSLSFALCTLVTDLLQYVWGSLAWGAYRWSLDQLLVNDPFDPSDLSMRVRFGWALARLSGIVKKLEYDTTKATVKPPAWRARRERLRKRFSALRSGDKEAELQAVLNSSWAPLIINRVASLFYTLKICTLLTCYVFLAIYLFNLHHVRRGWTDFRTIRDRVCTLRKAGRSS
jgi:hypothetical protein